MPTSKIHKLKRHLETDPSQTPRETPPYIRGQLKELESISRGSTHARRVVYATLEAAELHHQAARRLGVSIDIKQLL